MKKKSKCKENINVKILSKNRRNIEEIFKGYKGPYKTKEIFDGEAVGKEMI